MVEQLLIDTLSLLSPYLSDVDHWALSRVSPTLKEAMTFSVDCTLRETVLNGDLPRLIEREGLLHQEDWSCILVWAVSKSWGGIAALAERNGARSIEETFEDACSVGDIDLIADVLDLGSDELIGRGILRAVESGRRSVVRYLLDRCAADWSYAAVLEDIRSAGLVLACHLGSTDIATMISDDCPGLLETCSARCLYGACQSGQLSSVKWLVGKGAELSAPNFEYACRTGNLELVEYIYQYLSPQPELTRTLKVGLKGACSSGSLPVVNWLIGKGARVESHSVMCAAIDSGSLSVVRRLIEVNPYKPVFRPVYPQRRISWTGVFDYACSIGREEMVDYLLGWVKDPSSLPVGGLESIRDPFDFVYDALRHACRNRQVNVIRLLIGKGCFDLNRMLRISATARHSTGTELLIQAGADDLSGALREACKCAAKENIDYLIEKDVGDFNPALLVACELGTDDDLVVRLIGKGANQLNEAFRCACRGRSYEIVGLLIKRGGANLEEGLRIASASDHSLAIVDLLVRAGAKNIEKAKKVAIDNEALYVVAYFNGDELTYTPRLLSQLGVSVYSIDSDDEW